MNKGIVVGEHRHATYAMQRVRIPGGGGTAIYMLYSYVPL